MAAGLAAIAALSPYATDLGGQAPAFPEDIVFQEAGLDRARFQSAPAEFDGRLVAATVLGPWNAPSVAPLQPTISATIERTAVIVFLVTVVIAGVFFARRNLRLGRSDRAGADAATP